MICSTTRTFKGIVETFATFAYPAELTGRDSYHKGIVLDILSDNGAGADESRAAYGVSTDDGTVGTERCAFLDECLDINAVDREMGTRGRDVGENAGGTAENIVLNLHAFIDRDIVLNTDTIADADVVADVNILTQGAVLAKAGPLLDVAEVPDFRAIADFDIVVDVTRRMNVIFIH